METDNARACTDSQGVSAVCLTADAVTLRKLPDILDVNNLISLLESMGVEIKDHGDRSFTFRASNIDLDYLKSDEFKEKGTSLRGSIMVLGPLLARFGKGYVPSPGGDKIGRRRLDTHFIGFKKVICELLVSPPERAIIVASTPI